MYILPVPKHIKECEGRFFIDPTTRIVLSSNCKQGDKYAAQLLQEEIKEILGFKLQITRSNKLDEDNCIYIYQQCVEFDSESSQLNGSKEKIKKETYKLNINENNIKVFSQEECGRFYGIQTLRQLIRGKGIELKCLEVIDYPQFSERGFYHDITRGKVPTLETLKELVDKAAFYKLNQLQLYVEHSFAFRNHSELWCGNDPVTAEEILELDEYCKINHIELVPSLASFGHLYHALSSYSFNDLCELDNSLDKPFSWIGRMGHHTLDVTNYESIEFIRDMLEEFIPLFSSDKFNICCDETFDLGEGKSKEEAERVGKGRLYVDFLKKIISIIQENNKKPMFWGDIILKYPELLEEIPRDVICLNWNYSAEATEDSTKIITESGLETYVCPGVSGWDKLMNDLDGSFKNIYRMVQYGKQYNATGVLNTDWGDYGHINLFANSMPGMIYGAALSWNTEMDEDFDYVDKRISKIEFGDNTESILSKMREIAKSQGISHMEVVWWKEYKLQQSDILKRRPNLKEKYIDNVSEENLHKCYMEARQLEKEVLKLLQKVDTKYKRDYKEFYISTRGIALYNSLYLVIKKYDLEEPVEKLIHEPKELAIEFEHWLHMYCDIWRMRNKESELFRIKECFRDICKFLRSI